MSLRIIAPLLVATACGLGACHSSGTTPAGAAAGEAEAHAAVAPAAATGDPAAAPACDSEKSPGCDGPAAATAAEPEAETGGPVVKVVFVGQDKACDCTRDRITQTRAALEAALGADSPIEVETIQHDVDTARAAEVQRMEPIIVAPALYFLDGRGALVAFLQGELTAEEIGAALKR